MCAHIRIFNVCTQDHVHIIHMNGSCPKVLRFYSHLHVCVCIYINIRRCIYIYIFIYIYIYNVWKAMKTCSSKCFKTSTKIASDVFVDGGSWAFSRKRTLFPPVSALCRHSVERECSFISSQPSESDDRECPVVTWKLSREGCRHSVAGADQVPSHRHGIEAPVVTMCWSDDGWQSVVRKVTTGGHLSSHHPFF